MAWKRALLEKREVRTSEGRYTITLEREDLSVLYPAMERYTLTLRAGKKEVAVFRTNTYEYSPTVGLDPRSVARQRARIWEERLKDEPLDFLEYLTKEQTRRLPTLPLTDVLVIQGSPRADGNCSILAGWVAEEVKISRKSVQVLLPDDMEIHPCIGCYQCYNTGACTFEDEMEGVVRALRCARLLVVCTPVYTSTVPAGLKALIDRCQALHAALNFTGRRRMEGTCGLLLGVCGRQGQENFACLAPVVEVFMENLGIVPAGEVLVDGIDRARDIRTIPGLEGWVRKAVRTALSTSCCPS
ncbi:flavodoxin family protein [Methanofollis aquaemaris]|uniref:Flavodoxin family protein n=2 Tax=Methanofollis aquaemaris TaxID=126734 RepID=A0A8A3S7V3_9EURY|nr:flavodoxin family protein [Methanofollis aquaemaris]